MTLSADWRRAPAQTTSTGRVDTGVVRSVALPGGRRLVVRREGPADAGDVIALYDRMAPEELYCRFFTSRRPPDSFVERMTRVHERGGAALVAVMVSGRAGLSSSARPATSCSRTATVSWESPST